MPKKKATILLIEDDPAQIMMYQEQFLNADYNVLTASNEKDALIQAEKKPDLIFLDLLLGNSDGIEILKKIRDNSKIKNLKVVILTNFQKNGLKMQALKLGALDYLVKSSMVPKELADKIKKYLKN